METVLVVVNSHFLDFHQKLKGLIYNSKCMMRANNDE
ncbi:MAG: hypothetical protein ACI85I_001385 [Arenicella sp.]|jgi:hypothetical protein